MRLHDARDGCRQPEPPDPSMLPTTSAVAVHRPIERLSDPSVDGWLAWVLIPMSHALAHAMVAVVHRIGPSRSERTSPVGVKPNFGSAR